MTPEQINQLIEQYGRPAFELAMKQVYIDVAIGAGIGLVLVVTGVVLARLAVSAWRKYRAGDSFNEWDVCAFLLGAGSGIALVVGVLALFSLTTLANPEWAALSKLLPHR